MKARRVLTAGALAFGAAVATAPVAHAASTPVSVRGEGWNLQGTYANSQKCVSVGQQGAANGLWAQFECASNTNNTWDLWISKT